jgi:hypothetical protein
MRNKALVDITPLLEHAASILTNQSPMLHTASFNLQDSMTAALEIMDTQQSPKTTITINDGKDQINGISSTSSDRSQ